MKLTKLIVCAMAAGMMTFAAGQASAYPLKLTAVSGILTVTTNYPAISGSNIVRTITKSFSLKDVLTVVTNQVRINTSNTPPAGSYVGYDPYLFATYLTNSSGYYYDLSGIVAIYTQDIATTFNRSSNGGSETDTTIEQLDAYGTAPDGTYFETEIYGAGIIKASYDKTGKGSMTITGGGADYGAYKNSNLGGDGVTRGSFTLKGTGTAEWTGAYSVYYYFNF